VWKSNCEKTSCPVYRSLGLDERTSLIYYKSSLLQSRPSDLLWITSRHKPHCVKKIIFDLKQLNITIMCTSKKPSKFDIIEKPPNFDHECILHHYSVAKTNYSWQFYLSYFSVVLLLEVTLYRENVVIRNRKISSSLFRSQICFHLCVIPSRNSINVLHLVGGYSRSLL